MEGYSDTKTLLGGHLVTLSGGCIFLNGIKMTSGTKSIIDDVLIWSNNVETILLYLECVCRIFQKYRVSFWLNKCHFLEERVEFVGHALTANINCPLYSTFIYLFVQSLYFFCEFSNVLPQLCTILVNANKTIQTFD